eukprot:363425_1
MDKESNHITDVTCRELINEESDKSLFSVSESSTDEQQPSANNSKSACEYIQSTDKNNLDGAQNPEDTNKINNILSKDLGALNIDSSAFDFLWKNYFVLPNTDCESISPALWAAEMALRLHIGQLSCIKTVQNVLQFGKQYKTSKTVDITEIFNKLNRYNSPCILLDSMQEKVED